MSSSTPGSGACWSSWTANATISARPPPPTPRAIWATPPASPWGADALTVSPYLGDDSLEPFVKVARQRGAGIFVLVKTSNPGGRQFQDLVTDGRPVYQHVAAFVERLAGETRGRAGYGIVGAVAGATYPEELAQLRALMPHTWFLVPGFGAQGGTGRRTWPAPLTNGAWAPSSTARGTSSSPIPGPEYRERLRGHRAGRKPWRRRRAT